MEGQNHTLMDGRLHVYKRDNSRYWQCSTYLGGRNHRTTTKEDNVILAKEFAKDWYMERYAEERRRRRGLPVLATLDGEMVEQLSTVVDKRRRPVAVGPTFKQAAAAFLAEYPVIVEGERNEDYVAQKEQCTRVHLMPFFGDKALSEITAGLIQEYRVHRATSRTGKGRRSPPSCTKHAP